MSEQKKKLETSRKLISQYKKVFGTPDGRAVLFDLMKGNYILWTTPFVVGDDSATMRNIGKQEVVKNIMHLLRLDPDEFLRQIEEQEGSHV